MRWSAITVDCREPESVAAFWQALLGGALSVPLPGWVRLHSPHDGQPEINFQPVPEPKHDKTRIHLDVTVADITDATQTVLRLGGRSLDERHEYDEGTVVVMADCEGNEFCLVQYFGPH